MLLLPVQAFSRRLIFEDNFNTRQLDTTRWTCPERGQALWSRWIADTTAVAFLRHGRLVCRAIPNRSTQDTVPMLTGAVSTKGKFDFQYGRVEVRMRTNLLPGNFPAAWMGRMWKSGHVPPYGEIDIVEVLGRPSQINQAWHTAHTTNTPRHGYKNTYSTPLNISAWHTYAIDWTPTSITWYVDGKQTARHTPHIPHNEARSEDWTFNTPFYLLLNQSIMHGVYGITAHLHQTYETEFDWVRVYQNSK